MKAARRQRQRVWFIVAIALAAAVALILSAIALSRVSTVRSDITLVTNHGASAEATAPVFRIEKSMVKLEDGTYCVPSAAFQKVEGGPVKRVEGRFKMLYAEDFKKTSRDESLQPVEPDCSNHLAEGAIWKEQHKVIIDPTNGDGISRQLFVDSMWGAVNEWESRSPVSIVTGQDTDGCVDGFDSQSPDGKNEYMFGFIEEPGVVAVAVIWGVFGGPVNQREIVETDKMFNLHYEWGNASVNPNAFGLQPIGTHEQGHCRGEGHTNTNGATMFPTASKGETEKETLLPCEANGFCAAYGGQCVNRARLAAFVDTGPSSRCGVFPTGGSSGSGGALANVGVLMVAACVILSV